MDVFLSLIAGAALGTIFTYLRVNKGKQDLRDSLVEVKTRLEHEHEQAQTEEEAKKSLETIFETTAQEALEKNSEKFIKVAQQTLKTHEEFTKRESKTLTERVAALQESVQRTNAETRTVVERLEGETTSLTKALTTPKIVGDWGEMQLKNLVEMAGMVEHCDFLAQKTFSDSDGIQLRPDMIVNLPGGRTVVVDAKVPMKHYKAFFEAETESEKNECLIEHWKSVKRHVKDLSSKAYWSQLEDSPDFVFMYMGEGLYQAAVQHDDQLTADALKNGVVLAPPSILFLALRVMAHEWRLEGLSRKAVEIDEMGKKLYERITTVGDFLANLGTGLGAAVRSYNKTVTSLETRLLVTAREFEGLDMDLAVPKKGKKNPLQIEDSPITLSAPELLDNNQTLPSEND
mgnify:CR=1 FL=1